MTGGRGEAAGAAVCPAVISPQTRGGGNTGQLPAPDPATPATPRQALNGSPAWEPQSVSCQQFIRRLNVGKEGRTALTELYFNFVLLETGARGLMRLAT